VSPWYTRQDRDRDHDSVRVRAFAMEALEQLKASFAVFSESALVFGDETSIIVRSVRQRFWVPAFSHRSHLLVRERRRCPNRSWSSIGRNRARRGRVPSCQLFVIGDRLVFTTS
jgi:hypothetical protein